MPKSQNTFLQGTLIALAALFGAGQLAAQTGPYDSNYFPPSLSPLVCAPGQHYLQVTHGIEDGHDPATHSEPTTPSADTVAANTWSPPANDQYDSQVSGHKFRDTFELDLPANATAMSMRINGHFGPAEPGTTWWTDAVWFLQVLPGPTHGFDTIRYDSYTIPLGTANPMAWDFDATANTIIPTPQTNATPGGASAQDVLTAISTNGLIDVWIWDDTSVDYLTVEVCYDLDEPEFEITKTLNNCQSFGPNANRCVYDIRIENHGAPYVGQIQIQDVTNQVVNGLFLFDANQNPFTCQEYSGPQPNTLDFSAGTITSPRTDICTMQNVSIDATPMDLTLLVQLGGPALTPPEAPLNCAAIVNWDGRPSGMATDEFPSDCEPAYPSVPEFEITKTLDTCTPGQTPDAMACTYDIEIRNHGDPYTGELQFTEILNVSTSALDVTDASGAAVSCQYFTHDTSNILDFAGNSMSFDEQRLCTLPSVSIGPNDVIQLDVTADLLMDQFHGPGSDRLNCASVVMWDGRPPLSQMQGNFPVDCIPSQPLIPDFSIEKTLVDCDIATSPNVNSCTYTIEITNNGGPYSGELQVEEILNVHMHGIDMIDANGSNVPCQVFSGPNPNPDPLTFSSGTIVPGPPALCTVSNAVIDDTTPLVLTATIELDSLLFFGPGSEQTNCALVVMWDGRPNGMATDEFPSHCIDAYPPAPSSATACELHIEASAPNQNLAAGDPLGVAFEITNEGNAVCETVRMINYIGVTDPSQPFTIWLTFDPNSMDPASLQPDHWRSPDDWEEYMQDPAGGNVPGYQYSFPATGLVLGGPGIPEGDLTWVHPSQRPGYGGPPVQSRAFLPGAQQDYSSTNLGPVSVGGIVCGIAVVSITEYFDFRVALSLTSGIPGIKPLNVNSSTANDVWADNINNALAADGVHGVSCVGFNV